MSAHAIGIDLGTTNCALASATLGEDAAQPAPFAIPQLVSRGEVAARTLLPSFLYLSDDAAVGALPWDPEATRVVGRFARDHGTHRPSRLVSSAKSWLSYSGVNRREPILPWQAPDGVPKVSPLDASAHYLQHLVAAWNAAHPDAPLGQQEVVLTVPASFDAVARELTVEAAQRAGLGDKLRLLEEPQAALYAWVADLGSSWRKSLDVGDVILVCDIGGGTTDFSLITVAEQGGNLELERVAVGNHILLGGDNMDLALAWAVKLRLEREGKKVDDWQMRGLIHGCRDGKEALLSDPNRDAWPLAIAARGSRMFGGTLRTELTRAELEATLLEGFFPRVGADARPQQPRRMGLSTLGLPYAADAAVTRHLAAFLGRAGLAPSAILFNGGVMRSPILQERVLNVLSDWAAAAGTAAPKVLSGASPDVAVSRGAAYYAWSRSQGGIRIRGGTARAYYVGVERTQLAVPGLPPQVDALCIAPFGMEEGTEVELPEPFGLLVGEPASFRFFCSADRRDDAVGTVADPSALTELAPIETTLDGQADTLVAVRLQARVTEVGSLELAAVEEGGRRWRLSFDVRVQ